jgi:hypothetical protein
MVGRTAQRRTQGAKRKGDGILDHLVAFNLREVVSMGFEARCVGPDGSRYLWHGESGLRVDTRTGLTTLVTDPSTLPESLWFPTRLGIAELDRIHGGPAALDRVGGGGR